MTRIFQLLYLAHRTAFDIIKFNQEVKEYAHITNIIVDSCFRNTAFVVCTPLRIILLCVIAATRHSILTTLLQIANVRRNMKRFCLFCTCDAVYLLQIICQQIQGLIVRFERLFRKLLHAAMGQELFDLSVNFTHKKTPQFIRHANPIN